MKHALHFPRIGKTLLAAALVAMAGTAAADQSLLGKLGGIFGASGETKAAAASRTIEGDITSAKALAFLYGGQVHQFSKPQKSPKSPVEAYAGKILQHAGQGGSGGSPLGDDCWEFVMWKPPVDGKYKEYFEQHEDYKNKSMGVCTLLGANYTEQGEQKFMLVTQAVYKEALDGGGLNFQPQPIIGAAIFVKRSGQWTLELEDKFIAEGSLWSKSMEATTATLQRTGPDKHGILLDEFIHAGAGCSGNTVSLLMPYSGGIKGFGFGDTDACGGGQSVRFDTASSGEYYDAIVTEVIPKGRREVKQTQRLRFQNGEYVKTAKKGAKKRK